MFWFLADTLVCIYPCRELSVHGSIITFKGRIGFMTYNPQKPYKQGMQAWLLADAATGYAHNWSVYSGTVQCGYIGVTNQFVMDICEPMLNNGHHVYILLQSEYSTCIIGQKCLAKECTTMPRIIIPKYTIHFSFRDIGDQLVCLDTLDVPVRRLDEKFNCIRL